jgi:hypothetical protein
MKLTSILIREYAGHPFRIAVNLLSLASLGISLGHWGFNASLGDGLVMASMAPGLAAIVAAAILKEKRTQQHA